MLDAVPLAFPCVCDAVTAACGDARSPSLSGYLFACLACVLFALIIVYVRFSYSLQLLPASPSPCPCQYSVRVYVLLDAVYRGPSFIIFFFSVGPASPSP